MFNASVLRNYSEVFKGRNWRFIQSLEQPFPHIPINPVTTMNPTKIHIIVPIIPEPIRDIMDFTILVTGFNLNILLGLVIVLNSSMHTSANCYVISLICSNLIILIEPLQQVLRWISDIDLKMNLDYIFLITFDTAILTIIMFNIEMFIVVCQKNSPVRASFQKISTAIKSILLIWVMCISLTNMELHMYDHFKKEIMYDIYVSHTVMFAIFLCIIIMLNYYILYDLILSKSTEETWSREDIKYIFLLFNITIIFIATMMPYRIIKAADLITSFCCSDVTIEIVYTMVKLYTLILPITCLVTSKIFRQFKITVRQQHEISTII